MALLLKAPTSLPPPDGRPVIFLAGSIEMGEAEEWQSRAAHALADLDVVILNPRRDAWDASWVQSSANALFREQVEWELDGLELATLIVMYFAEHTKAPVTLLELGLWARSGKLIVGCPPGYWRRGNLEVVSQRHGVPLFPTLEELLREARSRLGARPQEENR